MFQTWLTVAEAPSSSSRSNAVRHVLRQVLQPRRPAPHGGERKEEDRQAPAQDRGRPSAADTEVSVRGRLVKRLGHPLTAGDGAVRGYLITDVHRPSAERVLHSFLCLGLKKKYLLHRHSLHEPQILVIHSTY